MNQRQFKDLFKKKEKCVGGSVVLRQRTVKQRTWQRCVIGIESSSFKSDTVGIIGARWRRRIVWKEKGAQTYKDKMRYEEEIMFRE